MNIEAIKVELGKLHEAGIPILAGTDTSKYKSYVNVKVDLHKERVYLSECGHI